MSDSPRIFIFESNVTARKALDESVGQCFGDDAVCVTGDFSNISVEAGSYCIFTEKTDLDIAAHSDGVIEKPYRLGAVLDYVATILRKIRADRIGGEVLKVGRWFLDAHNNRLNDVAHIHGEDLQGHDYVALTDKEKDILVCLYNNTDRSVSREELLSAVWGYVDSVETHTLETHIYRLRQKIEKNPAEPLILLTTETGYRLCVD